MERIEKQPFIREEMRIPDVTNMDGLVSLMGRSMDNEESFHIDLLLASLSRMHPFVKQEDVERMVPVFEMARTVVEGGKDGVGELDVLAASFLLPDRKDVSKARNNNHFRTINPIWIL